MMLTRWSPRTSTLAPWHDVDRWLNEVLGRGSDEGAAGQSCVCPLADVVEIEDGYTVELELPGLKAKEVNVEVSENVLTVSGEKKADKQENTKGYSRMERTYGSFSRSFRLPTSVDETKISADFEDGVLKISIPKSEQVRPKQIEVKAG